MLHRVLARRRGPLVIAGVVWLLQFLVVDGLRLVAEDAEDGRWAAVVIVGAVLYAVVVIWYFDQNSHRRSEREAAQAPWISLYATVAPTLCVSGLIWFGAAAWTLWLALGSGTALLVWWTWLRLSARRRTPSAAP